MSTHSKCFETNIEGRKEAKEGKEGSEGSEGREGIVSRKIFLP